MNPLPTTPSVTPLTIISYVLSWLKRNKKIYLVRVIIKNVTVNKKIKIPILISMVGLTMRPLSEGDPLRIKATQVLTRRTKCCLIRFTSQVSSQTCSNLWFPGRTHRYWCQTTSLTPSFLPFPTMWPSCQLVSMESQEMSSMKSTTT